MTKWLRGYDLYDFKKGNANFYMENCVFKLNDKFQETASTAYSLYNSGFVLIIFNEQFNVITQSAKGANYENLM